MRRLQLHGAYPQGATEKPGDFSAHQLSRTRQIALTPATVANLIDILYHYKKIQNAA